MECTFQPNQRNRSGSREPPSDQPFNPPRRDHTMETVQSALLVSETARSKASDSIKKISKEQAGMELGMGPSALTGVGPGVASGAGASARVVVRAGGRSTSSGTTGVGTKKKPPLPKSSQSK